MTVGNLNNTIQRIPIKPACDGYYLRWWYNGWHYWFFLPGKITTRTEGEKYFTLGTQVLTMGTGNITYEQCEAIKTIKNTKEVYLYTITGWANVRLEPGSIQVYNNSVDAYEIELTVIVGSRTKSENPYSPVIPIPVEPPHVDPDIEITDCINGQIWLSKNYASSYPGSKVYNNDEANRTVYGGLYTWNQIMSSGFCPVGFHVPSLAEWQKLIDTAGGDAVGSNLKEIGTTNWLTPNEGATGMFSFNIRGGGSAIPSGVFQDLKARATFWTSDVVYHPWGVYAKFINFYSEYDYCANFEALTSHYFSVRLIKDDPCDVIPYSGDGALYNWYTAKGIV